MKIFNLSNPMGFFSDLVSATVKVALTPVAVVKDAVDVATGQEPENTKKLVKSVGKDVDNAIKKVSPFE